MLKQFLDTYFAFGGILGLLISSWLVGYTFIKSVKYKQIKSLILLITILLLLAFSYSLNVLIWGAAIILILNSLFYIFFTIRFLFKKKRLSIEGDVNLYPTVSVLIAAKNEGKVITETLKSLRNQEYQASALDIIVINDGSDDDTAKICNNMMKLMPNLKLISNSVSLGKSVSLNKTLQTLTTDYVLILDADHLMDKFFIKEGLRHFQDKKVACVQGKNTVRNGKESLLSKMVQIEYIGRYEVIYPGKPMTLFMGSGAIFKTEVLKNVGGFNEVMLTEDVEVSYRIYETGGTIVSDNSISTYELACADLKNYFKQRHRWFRGIWQSFALHIPSMMHAKEISATTLIYFFYVIVENLALTSYLFLNVMYALDFFQLLQFDLKFAVQFQTYVLGLVLGIGIIASKKYHLLIALPLALFYYVLYAWPNITAMMDNMVLKAPYKWVKTDRSLIKEEVAVQ